MEGLVAVLAAEDDDPLDAELARLEALTEGRMPMGDIEEAGTRETVPAKS